MNEEDVKAVKAIILGHLEWLSRIESGLNANARGATIRSIVERATDRRMERGDRKRFARVMDLLVDAGKVRRVFQKNGTTYKLADPLQMLAEIPDEE